MENNRARTGISRRTFVGAAAVAACRWQCSDWQGARRRPPTRRRCTRPARPDTGEAEGKFDMTVEADFSEEAI